MENLTEDQFYEKYNPKLNHFFNDEDATSFGGCMYETYGKEVEHVLSVARNPETANTVWTIIDGDDESLWIVAGYHLVNRMGYLITEEPWQDEFEQYICEYLKQNTMSRFKDAEDLLTSIDYELLREQKKVVLGIMPEVLTSEQVDALEGILNLIDEIQDLIVDFYNYEPLKVYITHDKAED